MNKLIIKTLKPLGIPVTFQYYDGSESTYITFFSYANKGEKYADDDEIITGYYMQLDIFSKTSYTNILEQVNKLMKEAGFIRKPAGPELFEDDTKLYHKPVRFFFYVENTKEEI
jgi:hypothetical protein